MWLYYDNIYTRQINATVEQVYFPQVEVVGNVGPSLKLLGDRLEGMVPNAEALLPLREKILDHLADRATEDRFTPQRIVHDVRQVMPADGIVALDNKGSPRAPMYDIDQVKDKFSLTTDEYNT